MSQFTDSNGKEYNKDDKEFRDAIREVAHWYREHYWKVFKEDAYASHVTKEQKYELLVKGFEYADSISELRYKESFALWQRINTVLTGKCVALLGGIG